MIEDIIKQTKLFLEDIPKSDRKKIGQFFTSKETAIFMADMFDYTKFANKIDVLDPGAGTGILSVAFMQRVETLPHVQEVHLTCYETDSIVLPILKKNLAYIKDNTSKKFTYEVLEQDYILTQGVKFECKNDDKVNDHKYDAIIGNPPYLKVLKNHEASLSMPSVVYGAPNLYFLFAAMSLFNLKNEKEMVYIIPRSWTSGAYFKSFREYLLENGKLKHIHLFVSRDKVFSQEEVLQETIIIKVEKTKTCPESVLLTSNHSNNDFNSITKLEVPYDSVVSGSELYVFLPTNSADIHTIQQINKYKCTLLDFGIKMKTGVVVDFRQREELRKEADENIVPLFYAQHIKNGRVNHEPSGKEYDWISDIKPGLIQKNKNYIFCKRFTAKEETRRLQCGIYLAEDFKEYQNIATQNKINFIEKLDGSEMELDMLYGIYALFNSTLFDNYYRILNGSTQVNSTEINNIPVPPISIIKKIGLRLRLLDNIDTKNCDYIITQEAYPKMSKLDNAKEILKEMGIPKFTVSTPYCLLALANIKEDDDWNKATNAWITVKMAMDFMANNYGKVYAPNSRESIRKQSMHPLRTGAFIEDNTDHEATNSSNYSYKLTDEALVVIKTYGTDKWDKTLSEFLDSHETLIEKYTSKKKMAMQPVKINGQDFEFSSGKHNELQKAIIEEFAPRFAMGSECLYVGDTIEKDLVKNVEKLKELGFEITLHDKMPDIILYKEDNDWIYFIESVTSVGPMDPKRIIEITEMTKNVKSGLIFVTAFLDFKTFKKFSESLAWETEVWIADMPDHMIHLNGDKFLGPRNK